MATRGQLGGLARATSDAALVLDAAGKSLVIIETVGVGQDEVDIVRTADISVVVLVPGTGDDVQALKAGIMEIADIFVVNKADREGADRMMTAIESNLSLQSFGQAEWRPPILKTEATTGRGLPELWQTIQAFRARSEGARVRRLKARNQFRLRDLLTPPLPRFRGTSAACRGRIRHARGSDRCPRAGSVLGRGGPVAAEPETAVKAWIDHVGIAAGDVEASLAFFRDVLGFHVEPPEEVGSQHVRAHFLHLGPSSLELLEATAPDLRSRASSTSAAPACIMWPCAWRTSTPPSPTSPRAACG